MNKLLQRQIKKFFPQADLSADIDTGLADLPQNFRDLLKAIDQSYAGADQDRALVERSLDLSSKELIGLNQKLKEEGEAQKAILESLKIATATLRPAGNESKEWLTSKDEVVYLANSLAKLISEEKLYEQQLVEAKSHAEQEKSKAEAILQSIGDGVFAVDLQANIILMNSIAESLCGFSAVEAIGKHYKQVFRLIKENNPNAEYPAFVEEVIRTGTIKQLVNHTLLIRKDGSQLPISDSAAPIKDPTGAITGCIVVVRDSSHERALEQAKDDFISIAAHQLRTPLGSVRWNMEMLLSDKTIQDPVKQRLDRIYKSNQRIITLVNDLLNVSRIDQGRVQNDPQQTNILEIIKAAVQELEPEAQSRGVILEPHYPTGDFPTLLLDPRRFREVIENLLSNAVKYNTPGGKVGIVVTLEPENIKISVADEGIGIPEVDKPRVFSKFYRAENAARSDTTGSGLGLFVVKSYVEGWGGTVSFESTQGRGTVFYLSIPREIKQPEENPFGLSHAEGVARMPAQPVVSATPCYRANNTMNMQKILVIEDETELQQIYLDRLTKEGFEVLQAFDGKMGLQLARDNKPDLILLDVMMPGGLNGFDVLEQLKIGRDLFATPVIMLTNLDTERETAISVGAVDYLVKSNSSLDQVVEKIKKYMPASESD